MKTTQLPCLSDISVFLLCLQITCWLSMVIAVCPHRSRFTRVVQAHIDTCGANDWGDQARGADSEIALSMCTNS